VQTLLTKEVGLAEGEMKQQTRALNQTMLEFTKKKISDVKRMFLDYVHAHIAFHGHALEALTPAFGSINDIDEAADLAVRAARVSSAALSYFVSTTGGNEAL